MKKKQYKEISKKLPKEYEEIAFDISSENRKIGLNKYEFNMIRDRVYIEVENLYNERIPAGDALKKKVGHINDKLVQKAARKTKAELIGNYLFIIFTILAVLFPLVYGLSFNKPDTAGAFSKGIYIFVSFNNMFQTVLYCCIGILITALIQNVSTKQRKALIYSTIGIGLVLCVSLFALGTSFPDFRLKINFIVTEVLFLALMFGGFFLEEEVSRRLFYKKHPDLEEEVKAEKENSKKESKKEDKQEKKEN